MTSSTGFGAFFTTFKRNHGTRNRSIKSYPGCSKFLAEYVEKQNNDRKTTQSSGWGFDSWWCRIRSKPAQMVKRWYEARNFGVWIKISTNSNLYNQTNKRIVIAVFIFCFCFNQILNADDVIIFITSSKPYLCCYYIQLYVCVCVLSYRDEFIFVFVCKFFGCLF